MAIGEVERAIEDLAQPTRVVHGKGILGRQGHECTIDGIRIGLKPRRAEVRGRFQTRWKPFVLWEMARAARRKRPRAARSAAQPRGDKR